MDKVRKFMEFYAEEKKKLEIKRRKLVEDLKGAPNDCFLSFVDSLAAYQDQIRQLQFVLAGLDSPVNGEGVTVVIRVHSSLEEKNSFFRSKYHLGDPLDEDKDDVKDEKDEILTLGTRSE